MTLLKGPTPLNRLRISSYKYDTNKYQNGCDQPGILNFNDGQCVDWGNPLSEIYLEALRYLSGKTSPTSAFNASDSSFISSLPQVPWQDPMPQTEWCANNSIITVSTGLNSFDRDQLSNDLGIDATAETNKLNTLEGITGNYLIGGNGSTKNNQCTAKPLSGLANAEGICPEVPSLKGGYHIAGLAYYANTHDMRNDRKDKQTVTTYSVALAESLPRFDIPVGSGTVTLLPACQANSTATAIASTSGWRSCSMTDLIIESVNYSNGKLVSGSFLVNWEDSTWGNDYDMDGIERLAFCVGSSCASLGIRCPTAIDVNATVPIPTNIGSDQLVITTCAVQAVAGHALRFGYTITGSTQDGVYMPILRPGGLNFTAGAVLPSIK